MRSTSRDSGANWEWCYSFYSRWCEWKIVNDAHSNSRELSWSGKFWGHGKQRLDAMIFIFCVSGIPIIQSCKDVIVNYFQRSICSSPRSARLAAALRRCQYSWYGRFIYWECHRTWFIKFMTLGRSNWSRLTVTLVCVCVKPQQVISIGFPCLPCHIWVPLAGSL